MTQQTVWVATEGEDGNRFSHLIIGPDDWDWAEETHSHLKIEGKLLPPRKKRK